MLATRPIEQRGEHNGEPEGQAGGLPLIVVERRPVAVIARSAPWRRFVRVARFVPLLMGAVAIGGVVGLYFQPPGLRMLFTFFQLQPGAGTSSPIAVPAPTPPRRPSGAAVPSTQRFVVGLGKIGPEGEVVTIAPPYGAGDARVAELKVREGDRVNKGAVLAVLDSEPYLLAAIESARAAVASRAATTAQVKASVQASRDEARASLARAETAHQNAAREFERIDTLRQRGIATEQAYDQRRAARDEAAREVERARATLSRYSGAEIDKQPDIVVAESNKEAAEADLARAVADLDKGYVRSPIAGTVLTIHVRPGEKPGAQGLMNLGDIDRMIVEVEVYQTMIGRVALGDLGEVSAEALPRQLKGTVSRVGLEVRRQNLVDASPAAHTDARVVKVTVTLDAESSYIARRFTNLQVTVRIFSQSES